MLERLDRDDLTLDSGHQFPDGSRSTRPSNRELAAALRELSFHLNIALEKATHNEPMDPTAHVHIRPALMKAEGYAGALARLND